MRKMRDRYFKGYIKENRLSGKNGKYKASYVYHGSYYYWNASREAVGRHKRLFGALTAADLALMAAISLSNSSASRNACIMIPVLLALIPLLYQVIGVIQFIRTTERVREFDFEEINLKLRYASLANGLLMSAAAALALVWSFFSSEKQSFIFLGGLALGAAACAFVLHIRQRSLGSVMTEEGDYGDIEDVRSQGSDKATEGGGTD